MINIRNLDSNLLKIDKKSYKNIYIYYIGYITVKDHVNIHSVNCFYFTINEADGYIEEKKENKYLIFVPTNKNKGLLTKYTEPWNEIKNIIETMKGKPGEFEKEFRKIKFQ